MTENISEDIMDTFFLIGMNCTVAPIN